MAAGRPESVFADAPSPPGDGDFEVPLALSRAADGRAPSPNTAPEKPHALAVCRDGLPADLKEIPRWVLWRYQWREGRWTKVPFTPLGNHAATTNATTWSDFATVWAAYEEGGFDGIGFVFVDEDPFIVWDFDEKMLDELPPEVLERALGLGSYTERSPGGVGLHVVLRAEFWGSRNRSGPYEVYSSGRFFALTGCRVEGTPVDIEPRQSEHDALYATIFPDVSAPDGEVLSANQAIEMCSTAFVELLRGDISRYDQDRSKADFALVMELAKRGMTRGEIEEIWKRSGLERPKLERDDYVDRTIDAVLAEIQHSPGGTSQLLSDSRSRTTKLSSIHLADVTPAIESKYVVKGLLYRDSLGMIYGAPGCGKTFFTVDLAMHIAAGLEWRGHRLRRGLVCYLAPEGPTSVTNRAFAWCHTNRCGKGIPFVIGPDSVNLRRDHELVIDMILGAQSMCGEMAQLVVVDTLSRAFGGGDENSSADMGALINACDTIRERSGACVLLVHHSGKDVLRGARGSSLLQAAADTVIEVSNKVATVKKQRDGDTGATYAFELETVELGVDEDGDTVTTCIAVPSDTPPRPQGQRLTSTEQNAFDALHEVLDDRERRREAPVALYEVGAHIGQPVARISDWRAQAYARMGDIKQDSKRTQFDRSQKALQAKGRIQQFEDFVWLT